MRFKVSDFVKLRILLFTFKAHNNCLPSNSEWLLVDVSTSAPSKGTISFLQPVRQPPEGVRHLL